MTAGHDTRHVAGGGVSLAPPALAGLLGATLLAGGMLGAAITTQLDSFDSSRAVAPAAVTGSQAREHLGLTEKLFSSGLEERGSVGPASAARAQEHVGLTERLFR